MTYIIRAAFAAAGSLLLCGTATNTAGAQSGWLVSTGKSPLDDSPTVSLSVIALPESSPTLNGARPMLTLRCVEGETSAFVTTGVPAHPELGKYDEHSIRWRIDKGAAQREVWPEATSGRALFSPSPRALIQQILSGRQFLFEFTPFESGSVVSTFPLTGLDKVIGQLSAACGWEAHDRDEKAKADKIRADEKTRADRARAMVAAEARAEKAEEDSLVRAGKETEARQRQEATARAAAADLGALTERPRIKSGSGGDGHLAAPGLHDAVGYATIRFIIEADGGVSNVVIENATDPAFGQMAERAVQGRTYAPGTINGKSVAVRMTQTLSFP